MNAGDQISAAVPARTQSIRAKIAVLLVIPLASLIGLWVFVTMAAYDDAAELHNARRSEEKLVRPSLMLLESLQHERRMSMAFLGDRTPDRSALDAQRVRTDQARQVFRAAIVTRDVADPEVIRRAEMLAGRLSEVDALRLLVDERTLPREQVLADYSSLADGLIDAFKAASIPDGSLTKDLENLLRLIRSREVLAREDALVIGVLSAGRWRPGELDEYERMNGARELLMTDAVPGLSDEERGRYEEFLAGDEYARFQALERQLLDSDETDARPAIDLSTWRIASEAVMARMSALELLVIGHTSDRAEARVMTTYVRLGTVGGLGLLAVIASTAVGMRIGRRLIRESRQVSRAVGEFTDDFLHSLPELVREGRSIDPEEGLYRRDLRVTEIARINEAFAAAGRAVVEAATREGETRRGVNEVFVTLARRNQALVHRQLTLLDAMERRTEDPAELDDLFKLDHLATRMRRHAEGLVILAGRTAGRTWRTPVPLVDVVRGAVAEVEDYTRVSVLSMPAAALAGTAVADAIHLLAELIENATLFSPPGSPVTITGQLVPNGFVVEIEDRGLGLKQEMLEEINRRLAEPPEFDLSDLGRLGLFVVGRLAGRHGVKVSLRSSPYGGTTAIVLVPADLIVESPPGGLPPAELRAQLPGPAPARAVAVVEQPAARALAAPPRPVPDEAPLREAEDLPKRRRPVAPIPNGSGPSSEQVTEELPRRRRGSEPAADSPDTAVSQSESSGQTAEMTSDGLPRRRRQESLSPRLRENTTGPQEVSAAVGDTADPDDAEEFAAVRARMASMQHGWRRGRAEAEQGQGTQEDGQ